MGANRKLPTMTDVARLAGVSQSTVSLVLRGKAGDNIPEATRDRIFQASSELGYRVNKLAGALNSTGSGIIGMLTDELIHRGVDLPKGILRREELVEALCRLR